MTFRLAAVAAVFFLALSTAIPVSAQNGSSTIRGFVTDATTGEALPGANVVILNSDGSIDRATSTDDEGRYSLATLAGGTYRVRVSFVGYESVVDTVSVTSGEIVTRSYRLEKRTETLDEITVQADTTTGAARLAGGKMTARAADISRIPAPSATGDLASYLQTVPGVVSIGDRGGQLYVRGGSPSQNLVQMDGILIYNPFHLIGFYSIFSEDLISKADVYAGGFPAEYSGRLSSVIDVTMRPGNKESYAGSATASPFVTSLRVEGPVTETLSFLASVRQSVVDRTAPTYLSTDVPIQFRDVYVKLHDVGESRHCALTGILTQDEGRINPDGNEVYRMSNQAAGLRCALTVPWSSYFGEVRTGVSRFENSVGPETTPIRTASIARIYNDFDLNGTIGRVDLQGGGRLRLDFFDNQDEKNLFLSQGIDEGYVASAAAYLEGTVHVRDWLDVQPGVVLVGLTDLPTSVEPRLRLRVRPFDDRTQFNVAGGYYTQTFEGISSNVDAGTVFRAWVPSPTKVRSGAIHLIAGAERELLPGVTASVEGYRKWMRDIPVPSWSRIATFTTETTQSDGYSYGVDVRASYDRGSLYGFVGYGYSLTRYIVSNAALPGAASESERTYRPPHDQRHRLNLVAEWAPDWATLNVSWQFSTGLPYTQLLGFDALVDLRDANYESGYGIPRFLFDKPYSKSLPTYHRLDVSAARTFEVGPSEMEVKVGAINVYDRLNVFYYNVFERNRVDQLPVVPYVALRVGIE